MARLGVNVDHVATLREARGGRLPDPIDAAREAEAGGAHGIVFHLREDRRHIQDADAWALRRAARTQLDFELAATDGMLRICLALKPELATLVPEKRAELTTEGGLEVARDLRGVSRAVERLRRGGIPVALFVDPIPAQIRAAARSGAGAIELHTGAYAGAAGLASSSRGLASRRSARGRARRELRRLRAAARLATSLGLSVAAGHGLDLRNARPVARLPHVRELNIGHAIVARSVVTGIRRAVSEMVSLIR